MRSTKMTLVILFCYTIQLTAMEKEDSQEEKKNPTFSLELYFGNSSEEAEESLVSTLRKRRGSPHKVPLSPSLEKELLIVVDTDSANNTSNSNSSPTTEGFTRVSNEHIKRFPKMFQTVEGSTKYKTANVLLQLGIVTNNINLVYNALDRGANPGAKRMSLVKLCGSPEEVEQDAQTKKNGKLIVGLCTILRDAHEYRKFSLKKEKQKQYHDDVIEISGLVLEKFLEQQKK